MKSDLKKLYGQRLYQALHKAGYVSTRSTSGVSIHKLAMISGNSVQICRRYLTGGAMPEYATLIKIANALNVTAGWLAFGEDEEHDSTPSGDFD